MSLVNFTLNGQPVSFEDDPDLTALAAIRDRLGDTSPKDGCSPQGQCGCCTILWNGKAILSCSRRASSLEGADVFTLNGLSEHKRELLSRAFVRVAGLQCGYCIPGIAARTFQLLENKPNASLKAITTALNPHLCRCTGYVKIIEAIELAATHWNTGTLPDLPKDAVPAVGDPMLRYQGLETVLGERPYVDDLVEPGMLYGALRLSDHPRAKVLSINTEKAEAMEGVQIVLTAKDVPGERFIGLIQADWPLYIAEGETTHGMGSSLASVAATTREIARRAAAAIEVEYEVLTPITDPHEALSSDAPRVHPQSPNLVATSTIKRGDVNEALASSAHVISETFFTQRIEHAFLEPEAALAIPSGAGGLTIHVQSQGVHEDQKQIAKLLGWSPERVLVQLEPNGGGFGGKEDLSVQGHTALLAVKSGRPVKLTLSRDQSMQLHPKRHPIEMRYTVGCDANGKLTAVWSRMWGDTGCYLSVGGKVLERAAGHSCGAYEVPTVDVEAYTVYTNNPACGAFRGFGANQAAFAIEGMMDRLAELVGIDGYDIRERNLLGDGSVFATGQIMDSGCGVRQTLEAVKEIYKNAPLAGIACGIKNTGIGNGMADTGRVLLTVTGPQNIMAYTGFTEMGQGLLTVLQQVVSAHSGVLPSTIDVKVSTEFAVECGMTTASRATMLITEAGLRAARKLKAALDSAGSLEALVGQDFMGEFICDFTTKPEDGPTTHVCFGYATQVVLLNDDGSLKRVIAAHDVGKVVNKATCEGQIEGAVHMGLGYALTEDLPAKDGRLVSTKLNDLRIIKAKHTPEIEVILLEVPDPNTEYGVKGVGEIGLVPTAPAVASALHAFDGIRRTRLPMRGSAAARAMLPRRIHEEDHA